MNKTKKVMTNIKKIDLIIVMLVFVLGWSLLIRLQLIETQNLHWDEFNFLGQIYSYLNGTLNQAVQNFHVHFFTWLRFMTGNEVELIITARGVMFVFLVMSTMMLWLIGRQLMNNVGAMFAVINMLSFSYVLQHCISFRYDPILLLLFLSSSALLIGAVKFKGTLIGSGVLIAISFLVSIKAIFYVPTWIAILLFHNYLQFGNSRSRGWKCVGRDCVICMSSVVLTLVVLYHWHRYTLNNEIVGSGVKFIHSAGVRMINIENLFPQIGFLKSSLHWDMFFWIMLVLGAIFVIVDIVRVKGSQKFKGILLLSFSVPLLSLLLYSNSYPYFYVSIIPPASLLTGVIGEKITLKFTEMKLIRFLLTSLLIFPILFNLNRWHKYNSEDQTVSQRELVGVVHKFFPKPVPYIDRCAMISSFPKAGPFMSSLVLGRYREAEKAIMYDLLVLQQPQFLLSNISSLNLDLSWDQAGDDSHKLLFTDFTTLKNNYVRLWGRLWIPGKYIEKLNLKKRVKFLILVEGKYQIEIDYPVIIDGKIYKSGEVVMLKQGEHFVVAKQKDTFLKLRFSVDGEIPKYQASSEKVFTGFLYNTEK